VLAIQQQDLKEAPAAASPPTIDKGTKASDDKSLPSSKPPLICRCPHTVTTMIQIAQGSDYGFTYIHRE